MKPTGRPIAYCMHTPDPENVEPGEAFDKLIWGSGEICNNCFAKPVSIELPEERLPPILYENYKDIQGEFREWTTDGTIEIVSSDINEYGNQTVDHPGTICKNCGSVHLRTWSYGFGSDLSKQDAIDRVSNLIKRLEEYGYTVNEDAMYDFVRKAKSRENLQGQDRLIFEKAVKVGIQN